MARGKGKKFWVNLINAFNGKDLTDEDFGICDSLDDILKTEKDKTIQVYWDIMITNQEHKEPYFVKDMTAVVNKVYDENHTKADFLPGE